MRTGIPALSYPTRRGPPDPRRLEDVKSDAIHPRLAREPFARATFRLPSGGQSRLVAPHAPLRSAARCGWRLARRVAEDPRAHRLDLGNFFGSQSPARWSFRLFSRWDYDWFRIEPVCSTSTSCRAYRVAPGTGRNFSTRRNTWSSRPSSASSRIPRGVSAHADEIRFLPEVYRFFILNYVVREVHGSSVPTCAASSAATRCAAGCPRSTRSTSLPCSTPRHELPRRLRRRGARQRERRISSPRSARLPRPARPSSHRLRRACRRARGSTRRFAAAGRAHASPSSGPWATTRLGAGWSTPRARGLDVSQVRPASCTPRGERSSECPPQVRTRSSSRGRQRHGRRASRAPPLPRAPRAAEVPVRAVLAAFRSARDKAR